VIDEARQVCGKELGLLAQKSRSVPSNQETAN
jgi:hypothetical protein